jgi:glucose/arabinose dehydrogenase
LPWALPPARASRNSHVEQGTGPDPVLPPLKKELVPTVNVAKATGWPADRTPIPADGTRVTRFASDLAHPRWLYVLPNGDVLVAETAAPERPEEGKGIKAWFMGMFMKKAGSATAEREPHHASARHERRRRRGYAHDLRGQPELAVRHGARRQRLLCREHRRHREATRTRRARRSFPDRPSRSPTCRPARATITGPRA